jgi:hypothetical protein
MLAIQKLDAVEAVPEISLPVHLRPTYSRHWDIDAMVGPYDEGYIVPEDIDMIYNTIWYGILISRMRGCTMRHC